MKKIKDGKFIITSPKLIYKKHDKIFTKIYFCKTKVCLLVEHRYIEYMKRVKWSICVVYEDNILKDFEIFFKNEHGTLELLSYLDMIKIGN